MIYRKSAPRPAGETKQEPAAEALEKAHEALRVRTIVLDPAIVEALQTNVSRRRFAGK